MIPQEADQTHIEYGFPVVGDRSVAQCCDGRCVLVIRVLHNAMMADACW